MSTFTKRIDADIRDLNHYFSSPDWYVNIDLAQTLGKGPSGSNNMGLRFTGVTIPQGATIDSAKITFISSTTGTVTNLILKIEGVDEDNTAEFDDSPEDSARTRTKTTANTSWSGSIAQTGNSALDTPDITAIVQEIVDRVSWASGNAMAFYLSDNGSDVDHELFFYEYADDTTKAALLTINYTETTSPSSSVSPSASVSPSSSSSLSVSPSSSVSPSASLSPSASTSPSPEPLHYGLKIAKQGINKNVQSITDPKEYAFTSAKGVLGLMNLTTVTDTTNASGHIAKTYTHNIGYPVITSVKTTGYDGNEVMLPAEWHSTYVNGSDETIEVVETFSFKLNANTLVITVDAYETDNIQDGYFAYLASRNYSFKVYQYFNEIVELA